MYGKVEPFVATFRPQKLCAGVKFGIVLMSLAALCTCAVGQPATSLALTNVISVGEDEFIEMANDGNETEIFEGLILTIDDKGSIALPDFTLEPGERIRFHLGAGESNETDIFLDSDLALDDLAGNLTLKNASGTLDKFAAYWTPEETARDWFEKGEELSMNGSTEEALAAYEWAVELDPEMAEAWIGKGYAKSRLAFVDKDPVGYNESLLSFERAIELNRSQSQAWNGKATVLSMMGRYEEAVEAYGASLEIGPLQPWVLVGKANALWKLGRHDESIAASDEAIDAAFETVEKAYVWFERAHLFAEDGDYNGTVEALNRATELAPDDKNFWINGGVLLSAHLGRYEEALIYIDRALKIDPEYVDAWISKAQILGPSLGRYDESLEACERAIDIDPEDPDTWRLKGLILMNLGRDEEALAAFEEAIELDPQNGYAWYLKGNLLRYLDREGEAEEAFARAEELGSTSPLAGMIAITEIVATGEDELIEITNNLDEAKNLKGWTLVVDEDETRFLVLPEYVLEPGEKVRVHFGSGEETETGLFMESEIVLNDAATNVTLRDEAGREVSFLGFENLPDGGVAMMRGSGEFEYNPSSQ
jgi:tetratricopeptide (TPR) repeat protein